MAAVQPLTTTQKAVLSALFQDRLAAPRSISDHTRLRLAVVLRALHALRRKGYVWHRSASRQNGDAVASWKPILTLAGRPVAAFTRAGADQQVADYLKTHKVKKLPPGHAAGTYKSQFWADEL